MKGFCKEIRLLLDTGNELDLVLINESDYELVQSHILSGNIIELKTGYVLDSRRVVGYKLV